MKFDFEKEDFINSLREMLQDYGRMILHDAKKCYALWLDYAPRLEEEGVLLRTFLELELGKQVTELKGQSNVQREQWRNKAVDDMMQSGTEKKDAECLVDAVLETLGLGVMKEVPKPVQPKPEPLPQVPPKQVQFTSTSAQSEVFKPTPSKPTPSQPVSPKPAPAKPISGQYAPFGPEEKIVYLNKHLPKVIGYKVAIIPNNVSDWQSLGKYTVDYGRGFQMVSQAVSAYGINTSDVVLGMVIEGGILTRMGWALVFSDECVYQVGGDNAWKLRYKEIERVEVENNIISLYKTSGERKNVIPFRLEYNTKELVTLLRALTEGEKWRVEQMRANTQTIEAPDKKETSPYYVKAHNLQPGNALLCRTTSKLRADNYMKECTYISTARKLLVRGKNRSGSMLYVELAEDCVGWVSAFDVKRC